MLKLKGKESDRKWPTIPLWNFKIQTDHGIDITQPDITVVDKDTNINTTSSMKLLVVTIIPNITCLSDANYKYFFV